MKYYYNNPLAAAWMCRFYAMRFMDKNGSPFDDFQFSFCYESESRNDMPFYIHPDSLFLLKPKMHDLVRAKSYHGQWATGYVVHLRSSIDEFIIDTAPSLIFYAPDGVEIIQRDNKAFIWPESEKMA